MKKNRKLNLKKTNIANISTQLSLNGGQDQTTYISIFNLCKTKRANGSSIDPGVACNIPTECR